MASYDFDRTRGTDRAATGGQDLLLLGARLLLGAIFVESGFGKLMNLGGFAGSLEGQGLPMPMLLAALGAAVECFGGLAVVLGAWTRLAAAALIAFTIMATLIAHRYWAYPPEAQGMQRIQFMKNLAIIGGFLALIAAGPGRFSVDRLLTRRR
ncbi:DoxX family protein [Roseomonas genomospecies 6]|uniref:DoxX family protein n=1 Tax=Roseomonas genomospecies 6 TaxID=214106 RepID=A0A9W7NJ97_9PROT|nr:DoxX family protein [Roseomonas genomospecies 6]KAA0680334.1 DoxX family protein [Roseomonas genomospecies 6]